MSGRELTIQRADHPPFLALKLSGFLAQLEVYKLKNQVDSMLVQDGRFLILDLAEVTFVDSAGIGSLTQIQMECKKVLGQLALVESRHPEVTQSLNVSALQQIIDIFPDMESAYGALIKKHGLKNEVVRADSDRKMTEILDQLKSQLERIQLLEERLSRIENQDVALAPPTPTPPASQTYQKW